jgi:hypothetical protein
LKFTLYPSVAACALVTFLSPAASLADTTPQQPVATVGPNEKGTPHRADTIDVGVLGGVGFPRPLAVEGVIKLDKLVLFGIEYSALPQITVAGVQASMWALAGDARVFPFKGSFFVGFRAGRQHLGEYASASVSGLGSLSAMQNIDTTFINPRMGFLWNWGPVAFGLDAGVQIPLSSSSSNNLPQGVQPPQSVTDFTRFFGQGFVPTVDLLRIGIVM